MKNVFRLVCFTMLAVFATGKANAGLLIDPYLGYETGTFKTATGDADTTATTLGARLAYTLLGFWVGVDVSNSNISSKDDTGTDKITATDMGLSVGYSLPIMFRVYAAYVTSSALKGDNFTSSGNGTKIGASYTGLPFIAINLEMNTRSYDKADDDTVGEVDFNGKASTTMLSVSMPFNL